MRTLVSTGRDFIGPYQLIRLIRTGHTTQVWEALREGEKERVALKVILREHRNNKTEIDQLRHEAFVAKSFDHPNVIKIFGFHEEFGLPLIAMQLFNARNLKLELRDRPDFVEMNLPQIIRLAATGLHHIHERGWIHCDVKPDNFLADEQGNLKVIDFSIAQKPKTRFTLLGRSRTIRGTRSYMSPEQIRRKNLKPSADMYSFGCVLFELLAGRPPFTAPTPDELLTKHLRSPVPSLQASDNRVTVDFASLVARMLSKSPESRPQTMEDFLIEFNRMQIFRAGTQRRVTVD